MKENRQILAGESYARSTVSLRQKRILIADHSPEEGALLAEKFRREGALVLQVTEGREVVSAALRASSKGIAFDVIVVDLHLPVLDGFSTTMLLRENGITAPVLSYTDRGLSVDEHESSLAGCSFHLERRSFFRRPVGVVSELLSQWEEESGPGCGLAA